MTNEEAEGKALARLAILSTHNMSYKDGDLLRNLILEFLLIRKENARLKKAWQKVRAEIEESKLDVDLDIGNETIYNNAIKDILDIIDKHLKEVEDDRGRA